MSRARCRRSWAVLVAAVLSLCAWSCARPPEPAATAPPEPIAPAARTYVALGDSYAAGPGVPAAVGQPIGCGRSSRNYPALVAQIGGFSNLRDVSCAGARLTNMSGPQATRFGVNPPQLDALSADTALVTITIGGNDLGFGDIVARCLGGPSQRRAGCGGFYARAGDDLLRERVSAVAEGLVPILARIRQASPRATVLVVGYPSILPSQGGGCAETPLSAVDRAYLFGVLQALNEALERQSRSAGARYVDVASASIGHDLCSDPSVRWVEGRSPTQPAAPFHPNASGMRATATIVEAASRLGTATGLVEPVPTDPPHR